MEIVHVASELAPIAKVGGLGDVLSGLSKALVKQGHRVTVILPKYDCIQYDLIKNLQPLIPSLYTGTCDGIQLILIELKEFFTRGAIYGESDDSARFIAFCQAASSYLETQSFDILHLHDWPVAACTLFFHGKAKKIFTIHNLRHQGRCSPDDFPPALAETKLKRDPIFKDRGNLMRTALYQADALTVVSPTYTKEVLTKEFGCDLEEDLQKNKKKLHGILNGIDAEYWNPQLDPFLPKRYSLEDRELGKQANKEHIQTLLNLPKIQAPLVVSITRLVPQKGPDLLYHAIETTRKLGGQFVLLGSTDDPEMQKPFADLAKDPHVWVRFDYDEPFSHMLYAAADMLMMPSIFEPCGLAQMIAMAYGTVPLVRSTGGLKDTVFDGKNGFSFAIPDNKGVEEVLHKGFDAYQTEHWQALTSAGMQADWSWTASAEHYLKLYAE